MSGNIAGRKLIRRIVPVILVIAIGLIVWMNWPWVSSRWAGLRAATPSSAPTSANENQPRIELATLVPESIRIPKEVFDTKRFRTEPVSPTATPEPLRLRGSIIIDPNRNARIHSLFAGQVVKIGIPGNMAKNSKGLSSVPELGLRPGDEVKEGQILAVIYSKDAGALKTDLLTRLTQLWADQTVLDRYEKTESVSPGVVPPTQLTQLRQTVQSDWVFVRNARRNLRASHFAEEEIQIVEDEAEKLKFNPNAQQDQELERTWAEYLVRAPFDGKIVEKNATLGDAIDTTVDLYKMAKLDRLQVLVDVYEEDLPKIQQIAEEAEKAEKEVTPANGNNSLGTDALVQAAGDKVRAWTVSYQATGEGEAGAFDKLGVVIDPMQHTGTVRGWVNNSQRRLFLGQFVIATIPLRPDPSLVAVPTGAVIESAGMPTVFVQADVAEWCDLRLMTSLNDVSSIPPTGTRLTIVAAVNGVLYFRIFDGNGKMVVDTDEKKFPKESKKIEELRKQLQSVWPPHELTPMEKGRIIAAVTSIVGYTPPESVFTQRKVAVVVRGREQIFLRREPNAAEKERGAESIRPGDIVVSRGAVELSGELDTLQSEGKK